MLGHVRDVPRSALLALGRDLGLSAEAVRELLDQVITSAEGTREALDAAGCTGAVSRGAAETVEGRLRRL